MVSPLQWVEYALVNPAALNEGGTDFMTMNRVFQADATAGHPWNDIAGHTAATLFEAPNLVLVRRMLDAQSGLPITGSTQVIAEFVTHFEVSFWVDQNSGTPQAGPICLGNLQNRQIKQDMSKPGSGKTAGDLAKHIEDSCAGGNL